MITYELRASLCRYTFMNTDEQVLDSGKDLTNMLACLLIKSCKKLTAYQLKTCCAWLALSPFVLTEHISSLFIYLSRTYVLFFCLGY